MDPLKLVILLISILFFSLGTNGGLLHQLVPEDDSLISKPMPGQPPSILSLKPYNDDHYAVYKSYSIHSKHYGLMATMDVYGFAIRQDQETAAAIWVGIPGDGTQATQNFILVGWHVNPSLYGDSRTHFFTYWMDDVTGDWWVYYGFNTYPTVVGHFPKSIFTGLANSAADFEFGGYVNNARTQLTPPMGSGSFQIEDAASFSDLQYILHDGRVSKIRGNLSSHVDNKSCYLVTPIVDGKFFYGGPGGCPN